MSIGLRPRASRRLRLTPLEDRALFDATPLGPMAVTGPVAVTHAEDTEAAADRDHASGCTCGQCVAVATADGEVAWALPPYTGPAEVYPRDPIPPYPTDQTFLLHSRPAATRKIYLDFNGHTTTGTPWNTNFTGNAPINSLGWDLDGSAATYTVTEHDRIQRVWQRVMEDFSPFDVDVTTEEPAAGGLTYSGGGDTTWGIRVVISPTEAWYPGAGGVAYISSFRRSYDMSCFVFSDNLGPNGEKAMAEATSHEVGHTLGLNHDGRTTPAEGYYYGHATAGYPSWAPIMGVGYNRTVVQWSKGEYANANNAEDDLAIITNTAVNFGYRPDDAGNSNAAATAATVVGTSLSAGGVIERPTDVDVWGFASGSGTVSFNFTPWVNSPNLDIRAELRDSAGTVLASNNPTANLNASISYALPSQGTYYLAVEGVGVGTASDGYTDYGSLGQYTVTGAVNALTRLTGLEVANLAYTENQGAVPLTSALTVAAGPDLNQATVAITNYVTGQDFLLFTDQAGITGNFDSATGLLTLSGTAAAAAYQTALRSITYTNPSENPSTATRTFTFRVRDVSNNLSTTVARAMTVTAVNDAPVADEDSYSTNEDATLTIPAAAGVLDGDTDPDNATLTATLVNTVEHGTLSLSGNGSFTYFPEADFHGTDTFTYRANDGQATSAPTAVTITVHPLNDAPVADDDGFAVDEDGSLTVPAATGVLFGDTDVEGSTLTAALVADASHGTLDLAADGSFTYTPVPDYAGTDTFTYRASDGSLSSNLATVTLAVNPVNDAPVADDDAYPAAEDTPLVVPAATGVLNGDTDVENSTLTAVLVADVEHGTLALNPNGSFTYTPAADYNGSDSFTYRASDGGLSSNLATVSLTVSAVDDAPAADNDVYSVAEDGSLSVPAAGVLDGDTDAEGTALTAVLATDVHHGTLTLNADGAFDYSPTPNFSGTDSFTYRASGGGQDSAPATVTLTVTAVNDAPVAAADSYSTAEDTPLSRPAPGLRGNDTDADDDPLTAVQVSDPAHGTLVLNPDGSFTYTPGANYFGPDAFTYRVNDGTVDSDTATVSLDVTPVNDPPLVTGETFTTPEDTVVALDAPGLLANDSDVEGSLLTLVPGAGPGHGALTLTADGSFLYTPALNYFGVDSFTYTVSDGTAASDPVTVSLTVTPQNDAPTATDDAANVVLKKSVTIRVLLNDADVEGGPITIQGFTQPTKGTLTRSGNNFIYTATGPLAGADSFTYTIADPQGATAVGMVNLSLSDPIAPALRVVRARYGSSGVAVADLQTLGRAVLPWAGLSRLEFGFSENVIPLAGAVTLVGPDGEVPLTLAAVPAGGTRTAVWTFAPLARGTYTLRLSGAAVRDINGNDVTGGYVRTFGVLPGDFDGNGFVDDRDLKGIKKKYQANPARADRFADINGDGIVNVLDYNLAKVALGTSLGG